MVAFPPPPPPPSILRQDLLDTVLCDKVCHFRWFPHPIENYHQGA